MSEQVEQNGVKFTPEKVVNLDELMNQNKPAAEGSGEIKEEAPEPDNDISQQDTGSESKNVESESDQSDAGAENSKQVESSSNDESDNIPLDELYLSVGDKEMNASQLLDEYEKLSEQLNKIKGDAFLNRFIDFYQEGGDPSEFLQRATMKWDSVSDVDLLRMKFHEENSDLEGDARDILFERELLNKYSINPDGTFDDEDSREAKVGRQLMKRDASKLRTSKIDEQKSYLLNQKKDESQQQSYDPEKYKQELLNDQELKSFVTKKSLPVGDGLSYEVKNPDKVIGMMANVGEFWQLFQKPDGGWDKTNLAKVFAFALDPKSYDDHILKLGQDMGSESYLKEQRNTVQRGRINVVDKSTDMDTVSVRDGRIIGTNKEDLLKAFIAQKRK
jgi:hypothetical protein